MFAWLASLFSGPIIGGLLDGYKAKLASTNSTEAHAVDLAKEQISANIAAQANAKEIRLATSGFPEVRFLFFLLGGSFTMHVTAICIGTTFAPLLDHASWLLHIPPLPAPFNEYEGQIIGFFFGSAVAMTGVQAIAGALARRVK